MIGHKVSILWSLLNLSSIPYGENMHGNKNDDFFLAHFIVVLPLEPFSTVVWKWNQKVK